MPMYKSPIRSLNAPSPMSGLSGVASESGSPLEQAAYLRGKMRAQEFIQKRQESEATQNRLMSAQEEAERRNAAREDLAQNRFEQAQRDAAARAAAQEERDARILGHQQWLEKFQTEKDVRDAAAAKAKEDAEAAKVEREIEAARKKEEAAAKKEADAEARRVAAGRVSRVLLGSGLKMPEGQAKGLVDAFVEGTPEEQAGIVKYLDDLGKFQTAKKQYEAMASSLASVDQAKASPDAAWGATVWVDKDPGPGISPSLVRTKDAKKNPNWKIIATDESGQTTIGGVPVVEPVEPTLQFGGIATADAAVRPPSARGGGGVAPAAAPAPVAPMAAAAAPSVPTMDQNVVTRRLKDGTTVRVRRTANGWEEVE